MFKRIHLNTSLSNKHEITVGYKIIDEVKEYLEQHFTATKAVFIIDENVFQLYKSEEIDLLRECFSDSFVQVVPAGESSKSLSRYSEILSEILASGVDRKTPVIVIGGGVTGDIGGFVAASCLRGMPLIHIPTTLLAMVDSSIGGKTGINHEVGKNLIGAFYQPEAVFADLKFLETLPHKELINGLGEVIKYGMIRDESILDELKKIRISSGFEYSEDWRELVYKCAKIKSEIVEEDFKEAGLREILNFGHTFAHVIERVGNYSKSSHGEAVFMGMWAAVKLSNLSGFNIDISNLMAFRSLYNSEFNTELKVRELTEMMRKDKKARDGSIKAILLEEIEKPFSKEIEDLDKIDASWEFLIEEFS